MESGSWLSTWTGRFGDLPIWKRAAFSLAALFLFGGLGLEGIRLVTRERGANAQSEPAGGTRTADAGWLSPTPSDPGGESTYGGVALNRVRPERSIRALEPSGGGAGDLSPYASDGARPATSQLAIAERHSPAASEPAPLLAQPAQETGAAPPPSDLDRWAPSLMVGGFSFFVAFCMGFALRAFAKISLVVLGFVFFAISSLAYCDLIDIHWDRIGLHFDSLISLVRMEWGEFSSFLEKSLPSTVMGGIGLVAGIKKK
jgi:uncharacterized membrane protein (Fun14 family)